MALFKKKKTEESAPEKTESEAAEVKNTASPLLSRDYTHVLLRPRITEKATFANEKGAYVFEVDVRATKSDVMKAMQEFYKVKPAKVNMVKIPGKRVASKKLRGVFGQKPAGKKAYVYLKEGDTIAIV